MNYYEVALEVLQTATATAEALAKAKELYAKLVEQAQRTMELTPEQSADLDARARAIFADAQSHLSGR